MDSDNSLKTETFLRRVFKVLEVESEVAVPEPGEDQVLVRVVCAGVNPVETYIREGQYAK